jgi:hypothetical protein
MFDTWSYESDRPVSLKNLREMVRRELPASIYRCKGIVYAADSPDMRLTLQAVGRRTEIHELGEWGERTPRTQIVAIGAPGGINAEALTEDSLRCRSNELTTTACSDLGGCQPSASYLPFIPHLFLYQMRMVARCLNA